MQLRPEIPVPPDPHVPPDPSSSAPHPVPPHRGGLPDAPPPREPPHLGPARRHPHPAQPPSSPPSHPARAPPQPRSEANSAPQNLQGGPPHSPPQSPPAQTRSLLQTRPPAQTQTDSLPDPHPDHRQRPPAHPRAAHFHDLDDAPDDHASDGSHPLPEHLHPPAPRAKTPPQPQPPSPCPAQPPQETRDRPPVRAPWKTFAQASPHQGATRPLHPAVSHVRDCQRHPADPVPAGLRDPLGRPRSVHHQTPDPRAPASPLNQIPDQIQTQTAHLPWIHPSARNPPAPAQTAPNQTAPAKHRPHPAHPPPWCPRRRPEHPAPIGPHHACPQTFHPQTFHLQTGHPHACHPAAPTHRPRQSRPCPPPLP